MGISMGAPENMTQVRAAYLAQKANAKKRGISWEFTLDSWIAFWGDDIDKRGRGHDKLCMQRFGDVGPYHPDNVKKGYPKGNAKTAGVVKRHTNLSEKAKTKQTSDDWEVVRQTFYGG
jgi:hypothetical protein